MTEYKNSTSDAQLEELLLLTEQMQEELDKKDRTIEELKVQLDVGYAGNRQGIPQLHIGEDDGEMCIRDSS